MPEPPPRGPIGADLEDSILGSVAARLKSERQAHAMTLQDLSNRSGLSLGMISKLENGQASPSLRTLARLADSLEVPVARFFTNTEDEATISYVPAGGGTELSQPDSDGAARLLMVPGLRAGIYPILLTWVAAALPAGHDPHVGTEFIYVLDGKVDYRVGHRLVSLAPGDALVFDGRLHHRPERLKTSRARVIAVQSTQEDLHLGGPLPVAVGQSQPANWGRA